MAKPAILIHAMLERSMKKMREAMILPGGIYSYLAAAKQVKMEDGGPDITNPLLVGGNPNVGPAKYYSRVPVAQTNELTTVEYQMTRIVGTYVVSDQEIDENAGTAKIVDIAATKMRALEISLKKYQRTRAANTNTGDDPLGLPNLLPATTTSGTIGGINLASEPFFRPSVYNYNGTLNDTNIEETLDDIFLDLMNDESKVTVIFAGRNLYNSHRKAARDNATIQFGPTGFGQSLAKLGLVGTTHQSVPLIYDEELHPDVMYLVNANELMIHILKSANMKMKELVAPYDQDVTGGRYIWEGQFCSWKNYRTHAFVNNQS